MKQFFKPMLLGILCGVLIFGGIFLFKHLSKDTYEGRGFHSPEDAISAYLEALQDCDPEAMRQTFAIETYAKNFDADEFWSDNYYQAGDSSYIRIPTDVELGYELAVQQRCASLSENIIAPFFMASEGAFNSGEDFHNATYNYGRVTTLDENDEIEEFIEAHRRSEYEPILKGMKILDIYEEDEDDYTEYYRDNAARWYGADDFRFYIAEVEVDGMKCIFSMQIACYDGKWYNFACGTPKSGSGLASGGFVTDD